MFINLGLDTNYFYIVINPIENVKSIMKSKRKKQPVLRYFYPKTGRFSYLFHIRYGLKPIPPSNVIVSPDIYLKSCEPNSTHTRPISFSGSPNLPIGTALKFFS